MGKQSGKPKTRLSWSERSDRLDGIRRDPKTGIVFAREHQHPLSMWFQSVPMGQGLPGMQVPSEACHLFAIHVFDNLRLPAPSQPLYRPRRDPNARRDIGVEGVKWVPIGDPEEAETEDASEVPAVVADISGYDDTQIAALKAQIREVELTRKLIAQADQPDIHGAP
ncbi:hypothetical protein [Nocardia sp. NPDC004711]